MANFNAKPSFELHRIIVCKNIPLIIDELKRLRQARAST
jgi:hypothetical protein